jgi:hypothetical protein
MPSVLRFDVNHQRKASQPPDDASKSRTSTFRVVLCFRSISAHRVIADHGVMAREGDILGTVSFCLSLLLRQAFVCDVEITSQGGNR